MKEACQKSRKRTARHEPADDDICPNNLNLSRNNFFVLNQEGLQVDESRSSYLPSLCQTPICRQFWKAGNYDNEQSAKAPTENGKNHLLIHPEFLHSNATSHKWVFGAIAELLDNAVDEIQNGATFVAIDKIINPWYGSPALLIQDNGGGMDPEAIRHCMSFGFSDKKQKCIIGQYGNGFKTSSMRLGADVIVFTRHPKKRTLCQSVGLLSYTFLRRTSHDRIVVPMVDYELNASTRMFDPIHYHSKEHFSSNLSVLLQWSPYSAEEMLLKQFDDIGNHGTKIVIYNLWLDDNDDMELDFNFDAEDICMNAGAELFQIDKYPNPVKDEHIANLYRFSLRVYASILYLRLPESFQIILRGRAVKRHNIASDLKFPEFVLYKPQIGGTKEAAALTTIGFLKEAPGLNVHGFNIYHRNRLILPFWRVVKNTTNSTARGVVGVLEANFIEPTHDKQDFEKTSLFQKLEARLKQMTMEYWDLHYGLIGYQLKKTPPASVPYLGPPLHNSTVQPVLLNPVTSIIDHPKGPISLPVESPQDPITTLQYVSGERIKRKKNYSAMASEPRKLMGSGSHSIDSQENGARQPSNDDETQTQNEERSLREENKRLQSWLLELERKEDDLNLKVQQLQVQQEYARILAEIQSIQLRKIIM